MNNIQDLVGVSCGKILLFLKGCNHNVSCDHRRSFLDKFYIFWKIISDAHLKSAACADQNQVFFYLAWYVLFISSYFSIGWQYLVNPNPIPYQMLQEKLFVKECRMQRKFQKLEVKNPGVPAVLIFRTYRIFTRTTTIAEYLITQN